MIKNKTNLGVVFALCAAALNGTIGTISKILISRNIAPEWIAFLKTVIAFILISIVLLIVKSKSSEPKKMLYAAISSFFGIFLLFFFETRAYGTMSAANVVIILMATGAVVTSLGSWWLLNLMPTKNQWMGLVLTIIGVSIILGFNLNISLLGAIFSLMAGFGYGIFTVLIKKFQLKGGLVLTRLLLLWGSIFLLFPVMQSTLTISSINATSVIVALVGLAVLPSILGFWCTTKSINYLNPSKVQLIELSEPVFAAFFAFIFLGEAVTAQTLFGSLMAVYGIYFGSKEV